MEYLGGIKGDTRNGMMGAQGWIVLWESGDSRIVEWFHGRSIITRTVIRGWGHIGNVEYEYGCLGWFGG